MDIGSLLWSMSTGDRTGLLGEGGEPSVGKGGESDVENRHL
jgi:hypothetical protein